MIASKKLIGAIEAGGTKFICAFGRTVDELFLDSNRVIIPTESNPDQTITNVIEWFKHKELIFGKMQSIGLASFGPLSLNKFSKNYGHLISTPKENWSNFDIVGKLNEGFPGLPIAFDTDVNGAALGEWQFGAAKNFQNIVYITIGTGIGAGIIINGMIVHGVIHPEVGHIRLRRLNNDDFSGACPFHGDCWEGLCSGVAIIKRTGFRAEDLPGDHAGWFYEINYTAQAIANIIYTLSPEIIIVGGSVSRGGNLGLDRFFEKLRDHISKYLNGYLTGGQFDEICLDELIVPPGLKGHSGIVGAFYLGASLVS